MRSILIPSVLVTAFAVSCPSIALAERATPQGNQIPIVKAVPITESGEREFQESFRQFFPLSPDQNRLVLEENIKQQESRLLPAPMGMQTKFKRFSLKPGAPILTLLLRPNYPTTIVFQDATGESWPIKKFLIGNEDWIEGYANEDDEGNNLLTLVPKTYASNSGLLVVLAPNIPVNLQLIVNSKVTPDQQLTLRADRKGPNAAALVISKNYPDSTDPILNNVLYGIPPESSKKLLTNDKSVEVYLYEGALYVRTSFPLSWPAFQTVMTSGQGETKLYAYKTSKVPTLLLTNDTGETVRVLIGEEADG